jgi:hypothetical protein
MGSAQRAARSNGEKWVRPERLKRFDEIAQVLTTSPVVGLGNGFKFLKVGLPQ